MNARDNLMHALRDLLSPVLRSHGYRGSAPTWRKSSPTGDWAVINVQSSAFGTAQDLRCVVNLAAAPEPWLRWERHTLGAGMPKAVSESLGRYRVRLHPTGTPSGVDGWWHVADSTSAVAAVHDMTAQLAIAGWPVLDRVWSRTGMLQQVRHGDLGMMKRTNFAVYFARAEAVLLMDEGPGDVLDEQLAFALENAVPGQRGNAEVFDAWVREQAQAAT